MFKVKSQKFFLEYALRNLILFFALICVLILITAPALSAPGSVDIGRAIYLENCYKCHGYNGAGHGPVLIHISNFSIRPRNFTLGVFKLKTSPPAFNIVRDEDLYNVVKYGMPGSGMPSFEGILSDQERWDVVTYIKSLSNVFKGKDNPPSLDFSGKILYSQESIARGKAAYEEFHCYRCHGKDGRALSSENIELTDKHGFRIWARDLTIPRTFSSSYTPEALYARVTNGIPGTPMPSFADDSKKEDLTEQSRWDVVNYIMWLAEDATRKRRYWNVGLGSAAVVMVVVFYFFLWPYMRRRIRS